MADAKKKSGGGPSVPVRPGDVVEVDVAGLAHEGEGVGRIDGFALFVPGALPGERVRVRIADTKKQYGRADLLAILAASPDRVSPPCAVYDRCGGCQLQHFDYGAQLRWKRQLVVDALERIGKLRVAPSSPASAASSSLQSPSSHSSSPHSSSPHSSSLQSASSHSVSSPSSSSPLPPSQTAAAGYRRSADDAADPRTDADAERSAGSADRAGFADPFAHYPFDSALHSASDSPVVVHPAIGMDEPWRYRNKVQVPIGFDARGGGLVGGFYARGSHSIVETEACLLQHERTDEAVSRVKAIAREIGIVAYDGRSHTGWLRHVVVKRSFASGDMMIVLVGTSREAPGLDALAVRLREALPDVVSLMLNVHPARSSAVFGEETVKLWGTDVIVDEIGGVRFAISAQSFYQVNPVQTEALYRKALEYAALTGEETVIDAYCGIGTISLFLARAARYVYGVEAVPEAVADARTNAKLNGIGNAEFVVGRAETVLPAWRAAGIAADVIVVDPPRRGCDPALLATIVAMRPARVVYVSCNPATLARDLRILADGGFRVVEAQPVDMFPWTGHVEVVCALIYKGVE